MNTSLLQFYAGAHPGGQWTLDQILDFTDDDMEYVHDYIQWAFPLTVPSRFNPDAPLLSEEDIRHFKADKSLQATAVKLHNRFLKFLVNTHRWRQTHDHNHLRITRMLTFLSLIGLGKLANQTFHGIMRMETGSVSPASISFWRQAVNYDDLTS
jgi:hypothetical protein